MTHTIKDNAVAVAADTYWLPIDQHTPRNVKVLAISKAQGIAQFAEIRNDEAWYTHWQSLPRFKDNK